MRSVSVLTAGTKAPDFSLPSFSGGKVALGDFSGKKLWLAFFRYASCPLCNLRIHAIIERYPELQARGLEVLAVFQSSVDRIRAGVGKQHPPFHLLADPEQAIYKCYALDSRLSGMVTMDVTKKMAKATMLGFLPGRIDGSIGRIPGDFLIDEKGVIQDAFYGRDIGDHIPFDRVQQFIDGGPA